MTLVISRSDNSGKNLGLHSIIVPLTKHTLAFGAKSIQEILDSTLDVALTARDYHLFNIAISLCMILLPFYLP